MAILLLIDNHIQNNPYDNGNDYQYVATPNFHIQNYEDENIYEYEPTNQVHMSLNDTVFYVIGTTISSILICYFVNEIYQCVK